MMVRKGLLVSAFALSALLTAPQVQASILMTPVSSLINQLHNNSTFEANTMTFSITDANGQSQQQFSGIEGVRAYNEDLSGLNAWSGVYNPAGYASGYNGGGYSFTYSALGAFFGYGTPVYTGGNSAPPQFLGQTPDYFTLPVAEPTTWAMMISGFAIIGLAMRRRVKSINFA